MYSRQSNKPSYLRENHSPECASLNTLRLMGERESHTAGSGGSWWLQIHIPHSQPRAKASAMVQLIRQIPRWEWEQQGEAMEGCCLRGCCQCHQAGTATPAGGSPELPGLLTLPFHLPTLSVT